MEKLTLNKNEVKAYGRNWSVSTKRTMAICNFIRGKSIRKALYLLDQVQLKKIAVPMKGEIPHRKGNIMSGRYPIKTSGYVIKLLKNLRGNANQKNLDGDNVIIKLAVANKGETPSRIGRKGRAGSRTHIKLIGEGKEDTSKSRDAKKSEKKKAEEKKMAPKDKEQPKVEEVKEIKKETKREGTTETEQKVEEKQEQKQEGKVVEKPKEEVK